MPTTGRNTAKRVGAAVLALMVVAIALIAVVMVVTRPGPPRPECRVTVSDTTYRLDISQAANAATIAGVARRKQLPDHAVTVALAAALQESNLRNLDYGDRDSVGLFQQRPSQGWGPRAQLLVPTYAAAAFYRELVKVSDWEGIPVNDAAQKVQRSGAPSAYAKWENMARDLAIALTGERPAGIACRFHAGDTASSAATLNSALERETGVTGVDAKQTPIGAWATAAWLVTHAQEYGLTEVALDGRRWTPASGRWQSSPAATELRIEKAPAHA
jgi:hypothetical protein